VCVCGFLFVLLFCWVFLLVSCYSCCVVTCILLSFCPFPFDQRLSWSWSYDSSIYNYLCNRYSIQHYVIRFVSDLRQVGDFLWVPWFPPPIKLTPRYNWNIVKSGVKHHSPNPFWPLYFQLRWCLCRLTVTQWVSLITTILVHLI